MAEVLPIVLGVGTEEDCRTFSALLGVGHRVVPALRADEFRRWIDSSAATMVVVSRAGYAIAGRAAIEALLSAEDHPRVVFYINDITADWAVRIWPLARMGAEVAYDAPALRSLMLPRRRNQMAHALDALLQRLHVTDPLVVSSVARMYTTGPKSTPGDIAAELGISRSTLYLAFKCSCVPPVAQWLMLVRLLTAAQKLMAGEKADHAAAASDLSDATTLRRSLRTHFGMSLRQVRCTSTNQLIDRWVDRAS